MSRPINYAIKYFPVMVDMADDPKILKAESLMGDDALAVFPIAIKLLGWIYGKQGYFIEWDDDVAVIFAKRMFNVGYTDTVTRVVNSLLKTKFFDLDMFTKYQILTSHGIQVQWKKVIDSVKGKARVAEKYRIISPSDVVNSETDDITAEETAAEAEAMRQSKVNKSKVDNSYLLKGEDGNLKTPDQTPSQFPAPAVDPKISKLDHDSHLPLDQCLDYIFRSAEFDEDRYKVCQSYSLFKKDSTNEFDYDKLYAWGRSFNRFIGKDNKQKTIKGWLRHFKNWLPQQPIYINPDELNMRTDGKSKKPAETKILGNQPDKAADFYQRAPQLPDQGNS